MASTESDDPADEPLNGSTRIVDRAPADDECVRHDHPVPPEELARYSPERDWASEADIASYVEGQARDEKVKRVERIKTEYVLGDAYEIWDVTTDQRRWWVITNLTNLYSQEHFPSLDYTLSFHVGLMMRMRSKPEGPDASEPSPFDEVTRRQQQAHDRYDRATESEDFQAVGMQLRESLLSLIDAMRRRVPIPEGTALPQAANFIGWSDLLLNQLCGGGKNKELRAYLKTMAKETWQLVNWLTHDRNASSSAASISMHACDTLFGHFGQLLVRDQTGDIQNCPVCSSRNIRSHYDIDIPPEGSYFNTCGSCQWTNHPLEKEPRIETEVREPT